MKVISKEKLNENTYSIWIESDATFFAGQFVQVKVDNATLRRPISVCDARDNAFRLVFEVRGKGTDWLANREVEEELDILASLGNGFPQLENKKIAIVGGGIGVPPLLFLAKSLAESNDITAILGFRNEDRVILKQDFENICKTKIMIEPETVIDGIDEDYDLILACGAPGMYKALSKLNIPKIVSLEERMGCGYGACYGCSVRLNTDVEKYARVCYDGPVFNLEDIIL